MKKNSIKYSDWGLILHRLIEDNDPRAKFTVNSGSIHSSRSVSKQHNVLKLSTTSHFSQLIWIISCLILIFILISILIFIIYYYCQGDTPSCRRAPSSKKPRRLRDYMARGLLLSSFGAEPPGDRGVFWAVLRALGDLLEALLVASLCPRAVQSSNISC